MAASRTRRRVLLVRDHRSQRQPGADVRGRFPFFRFHFQQVRVIGDRQIHAPDDLFFFHLLAGASQSG